MGPKSGCPARKPSCPINLKNKIYHFLLCLYSDINSQCLTSCYWCFISYCFFIVQVHYSQCTCYLIYIHRKHMHILIDKQGSTANLISTAGQVRRNIRLLGHKPGCSIINLKNKIFPLFLCFHSYN